MKVNRPKPKSVPTIKGSELKPGLLYEFNITEMIE